MPRKVEFRVYGFDELSPKAKKKAIEDFRKDPELTWDEVNSQMLSETFEQDLEDHFALGEMEVGWSLSYSQGDGVCFWGTVDVDRFVAKEVKDGRLEKRFLELANIGAEIENIDSRYCHWNSMDVEVEDFAREEDLVPPETLDIIQEWEEERGEILAEWQREWAEAKERSMAPIREWESRKAEHEAVRERWERKKKTRGAKAWLPGDPGPFTEPKPEPLDIPLPEEPKPPEPPAVEAARKRLEDALSEREKMVEAFDAHLGDRVKDISRELEDMGYREIEYHSTDEYIVDQLENLNWEFLEDGTRWER